MRANLVQREPARLEHWRTTEAYRKALAANAGSPAFILHDGPPFTSGDAHIGTALNKVLKDCVLRYKLARGFHAPFVPGWDCHGLPIEAKVTRQLQAEGKSLPPAELRDACAAFSRRYIESMRKQFQRLGVIGDWENEYRTLDPTYEAEVLRAFADFVGHGLVYRSKKPVYWSIACETALAEAEIEYRDHTSPSIWVAFSVIDAGRLQLPSGPAPEVVIWTTTPWTLPANLAIALHPNLDYAVVRAGDRRFLVAAGAVERFAADCGLEGVTTEATLPGRELEHLRTRHPFIDRESPVVLAEYVTLESGTGCVHTAPGHGLEDYHTGLAYGLEIYCPIDDQGRFVDDGRIPPALVGLGILDDQGRSPANRGVLEMLRANGALLRQHSLNHSYPHCWRSKTPVVFRAMDQWFISVDREDLRRRALDAIGEVTWHPAWGENRIRGAVEGKPDWCISRQRQWGVPIPAFFDAEGKAFLDAGVVRGLAAKIAHEGTGFWFRSAAATLLEGIELPADWPSPDSLAKGTDTLDVWIESGASHLAVLAAREGLDWPADLYLEGSDQHRGWFQSSLWTAMVSRGRPPYRQVLTHGFIVGQDGRKISKSDGKPQTSDTFVERYGADVIRLWIASEDFRNDIPLSEEILKHIAETYRLLRNTFRFQISNLFDFQAESHAVPEDRLDPIDRWALARLREFCAAATRAYDQFEFHRVYQLANQFCAVTLSSQYHDILKDRLYTLEPGHPLRRSSQTVIARGFHALVRTLAPILPFTTDEAWAHFLGGADFSDQSLLQAGWPEEATQPPDTALLADFDELLRLRGRVNEQIEAARQAGTMGKSTDARIRFTGPADDPAAVLLTRHRGLLEELFIVSQVSLEFGSHDAFAVVAEPALGGRCPRCWRWYESLSGGRDNDELCPRCHAALDSLGTSVNTTHG